MKIGKMFELFSQPPPDCRPLVRWWWFGNALDPDEILRELNLMLEKGIGGVEIQPIYSALKGLKIKSHKDTDWLSSKWLDLLAFTVEAGKQLGLQIHLTFGSGWPFGGPHIPLDHASMKVSGFGIPIETGEDLEISLADLSDDPDDLVSVVAINKDLIADGERAMHNLRDLFDENHVIHWRVPNAGDWYLFWYVLEPTRQKVKRASPGAEGLVLDHLDSKAFWIHANFMNQALESRFGRPLGSVFTSFFCDSWEVYGENWTRDFPRQFLVRMGYEIEPWLYILDVERICGITLTRREKAILYDYKKVHSDLIISNFFTQFVLYCQSAGVLSRVQPYSAPVDLLRAYGLFDILEIEGFGP
ncbi:MAG: glycosyl hydrolase, partial [Promethearchaeota archaeon]